MRACFCLCVHTYSHMGFLDHADIIGSVSDGQGDRFLWGRLKQMHHLNTTWNIKYHLLTGFPLTQTLEQREKLNVL